MKSCNLSPVDESIWKGFRETFLALIPPFVDRKRTEKYKWYVFLANYSFKITSIFIYAFSRGKKSYIYVFCFVFEWATLTMANLIIMFVCAPLSATPNNVCNTLNYYLKRTKLLWFEASKWKIILFFRLFDFFAYTKWTGARQKAKKKNSINKNFMKKRSITIVIKKSLTNWTGFERICCCFPSTHLSERGKKE